MAGSELEGVSILIVEDELLVAMDIADAFESIGAATAIATTLEQALVEVEAQDLKAAVVDHVLGPEDSSPLCVRLNERALPFLIYTGLGKGEWSLRSRCPSCQTGEGGGPCFDGRGAAYR